MRCLIVGVAGAAAGVATGVWLERRCSASSSTATTPSSSAATHAPGTEAHEIETHIQETQVPARALGITVQSVDDQALSLVAPHALNRNVHGTAFAGSLYAIGVLCSYYLGRAWVRREGLANAGYELVAKAGRIRYQRPCTTDCIVARSVLPPAEALAAFRKELEATGKAFIEVSGCVMQNDKVACEYTIEVCGFRPRAKAP
jgi:thioesterase domain-containing protein